MHTLRTRDDFLSSDEDIEGVAELRVFGARHRVERTNLQQQHKSSMSQCKSIGFISNKHSFKIARVTLQAVLR